MNFNSSSNIIFNFGNSSIRECKKSKVFLSECLDFCKRRENLQRDEAVDVEIVPIEGNMFAARGGEKFNLPESQGVEYLGAKTISPEIHMNGFKAAGIRI